MATATALPARKAPWGVAATLVWLVVLCVVLVASQLLVAGVFVAARSPGHAQTQLLAKQLSTGAATSVALCVSSLIMMALIVGVVALRRGPTLRDYLALQRVSPAVLGKSAALALLIGALSDVWLVICGQPRVHPSMRQQLASADGLLPLLLVGVVIAAPMWEELLFRGFVLSGFIDRMPFWLAAVLSTAPWTLLHVQYGWPEWAALFLTGVAFAQLRHRTASLWPPLLCHVLINLLGTLEALWT